ncbi:MAG: hypothetical protein ACYS3S_18615 [Planctomycetota bacterium]|jgi:hypothetical protein
MCKQLIYLMSVVLVLVSVSSAAEVFWSDGAADHNHLWTDPDNWEGGKVPGVNDEAQILSPQADDGHGPIIQDGMDIKLVGIKNELEGRPGKPELTITGGNVELTDFVWWGDYDYIEAFWYQSGGTVTVANEFELGWGPGTGGAGTLDMTGGTIIAGELVIPTGSGAYGEFYLRGGTFEVREPGGLEMNNNGLIDVSGGTLIIEGDSTAQIEGFIDAGQITFYDGVGLAVLDYDGRNPGKTTLSASDHTPADGSYYEDVWVNLTWLADDSAASYDVYLGDDFESVNNGTGDTFRGNQTALFYIAGFPPYAYPDGLVPGTTYYWRIDKVEADGVTKHKGDVWYFTVPPNTAYNPDPVDGAEFVDPNVELSWTAGFGAMLHTVYIGKDYEIVNNATGGTSQVPTTYSPGTLEPAKVYYWRVDEFDGDATYKGDVWSFTTPGAVGRAVPANGAEDVKMTAILSWSPADNTSSHEVYFGKDKDAVRDADKNSPEYKVSQALGAESFDPGNLSWHAAYYWRIDEVDTLGSTQKGPLWSFTTADFISIDDIEDYDAGENQIWYAWRDGLGFGTPENPPYSTGNGTGSAVGDETTPSYCEEVIVHGGGKSMPVAYDNNKQGYAFYSEVEKTLTYPRDWTEEGVGELTIWFRGLASNDPEPLYVAVSNSTGDPAIVIHDDPAAAQVDVWTKWVIPLQDLADQGIDLTDVDRIALGQGTRGNITTPGGAGKMYYDDLKLDRSAEVAE